MRWFTLIASVLAGLVLGAAPVTAAPARAVPASGLRLMTYNVNYGNPDVAATLDAIAGADADIVLLQEITASWRDALEQRFAAQYAHRAYRIHTRAAGGLLLHLFTLTHIAYYSKMSRRFSSGLSPGYAPQAVYFLWHFP